MGEIGDRQGKSIWSFVCDEGSGDIYLTTDSKIDVERLRAEIKQDFAKLDGWSSAVSNLKERMKEVQTTPGQDIAKV